MAFEPTLQANLNELWQAVTPSDQERELIHEKYPKKATTQEVFLGCSNYQTLIYHTSELLSHGTSTDHS